MEPREMTFQLFDIAQVDHEVEPTTRRIEDPDVEAGLFLVGFMNPRREIPSPRVDYSAATGLRR